MVVLGLAVLGVLYGPTLLDALRAMQFQPSEQITSIRNRIGLTGHGERIFYATAPAIEDKTQFNKSCQSTERTAAILGCYFKDRIYLYNIKNAELDGTLEVTAAHELLHAVYHRLNGLERPRVDQMVRAQYEKIKDNANLKQIMQYYQRAEPGAEADELHSIIGTTVRDLSPELERHYATYFTDRAKVVALNESYNRVFSGLSQRADSLQKKIESARPVIEQDLKQYEVDLEQMNLDIQTFNQRASSGGFNTQAEFQATRAALLSRANALTSRRQDINGRVAALNADITALNEIAVHVNQLNESINGVSAPTGL
ncbi:hypothetical protein FBF31_02410 [Candidatus Saccharibacteria bacterium oral taxon 955]|nr:hypothetical protein FBF33_02400 [Candidatus Saccharibacteria bacterium oral taxon 955]QJU05919.1 hypothetical protein FBF31_02410 [Candidatus Saccharibacteria bacterium oral taxon 955]